MPKRLLSLASQEVSYGQRELSANSPMKSRYYLSLQPDWESPKGGLPVRIP